MKVSPESNLTSILRNRSLDTDAQEELPVKWRLVMCLSTKDHQAWLVAGVRSCESRGGASHGLQSECGPADTLIADF